ncbi:hypothetical protein FJY94_04690 [Candidatus Kaiserbacteria bacterium]|nr:hypothetical protein [Candidatus Kaiserbacteria bacterium]
MRQLELDFEAVQLEFVLERSETPDDYAAELTVWNWEPWGVAPAGHFCVFAVEPVDSGPVILVYRFLENAKRYADRWKEIQGGEAQVHDDKGQMVYRVVAPEDAPSLDPTYDAEWNLAHGHLTDNDDDPIPFG